VGDAGCGSPEPRILSGEQLSGLLFGDKRLKTVCFDSLILIRTLANKSPRKTSIFMAGRTKVALKFMQDIDLFLKVLDNAENKIDYEYSPQDGIAITTNPSSVMKMPNVKSRIWIFQRDTEGKPIHRASFGFNAQGQLEFVTIE
jgi:hypothetical protein